MYMLRDLLRPLVDCFPTSVRGRVRARWFLCTLLAIILPIASARTSDLLRALEGLYGMRIPFRRYYRFMASPQLPWKRLWRTVWQLIPDPSEEGRVLVAVDDSINAKTGKLIYGCHRFFDHAAKPNQCRYPWSQNIVLAGLLKKVKGRWACLPMAFRFYHRKKDLEAMPVKVGRHRVTFQNKLDQAAEMLIDLAREFKTEKILAVTDSWFGNRSLLKPVRKKVGDRFDILSRLRSNVVVFQVPTARKGGPGRPRKYGPRLGNVAEVAGQLKDSASTHTVELYGRIREVQASAAIVVLKSMRCRARVVWVFRETRWIALVTTDLDLSIRQIIEFYGARWKIEAGFKELRQDIGSGKTQTREAYAVINHLEFCCIAMTITWIYADLAIEAPTRRHAVQGRSHFAFSDARRAFTRAAHKLDFDTLCPGHAIRHQNPVARVVMRLVA